MNAEITPYDFSRLPPHIITNILSYLPVHQLANLSSVCSAWREASYSQEITNRIAVHLYGKTNVDRFFNPDVDVRPFASVYFSGCEFNQLGYRNLLDKFCAEIHHLQFIKCDIRFDELLECVALMDRLESLTLETHCDSNWNANLEQIDVTDVLIKKFSEVKSLSIKCESPKCFTAVNWILGKCSNLDSLTYGILLKDPGNGQVAEIYENMIIAMDQWNRVKLNFLSIENSAKTVSDTFLRTFQILKVIRIKKLNLRNINTDYDPKSFNEFISGVYYVEDLDVTIKEYSNLSTICNYMTNLKRLSINAICTKSIGIIEKLQKLEILEITACNVPEDELLTLFTARMPKLQKLSLNLMIVNQSCLNVLCNNFKHLKYLNVTLNTKCCYPIFNNLHNLQHLTIYWEEDIADDKFDLLENCSIVQLKKLERLYIDVFMPGMTADQIAQLPSLKYFKCMTNN